MVALFCSAEQLQELSCIFEAACIFTSHIFQAQYKLRKKNPLEPKKWRIF